MDQDTLRCIVDQAVRQANPFSWWYIAGLLIIPLIGSYLGQYIAQKGKNLATREDIGEITGKVEEVRSAFAKELQDVFHQNQMILERTRERHELRLAALDQRLETHQQAYELWIKLVQNTNNRDRICDVVMECQHWWVKNCLYLSENTRKAFPEAYLAAQEHLDFCESTKGSSEAMKKQKEHFHIISRVGEIIVEDAGLPSIGHLEGGAFPDMGLED